MSRIPVAIINNSLTPYRVHLHYRIAREMPDIELWSPTTHDDSNSRWSLAAPAEIRAVPFGSGQSVWTQSHPRFAAREWRKAGRIIRWLRDRSIRAVVLGGYNDLGRLRIVSWCHRNGVACFLFADSNVRGDFARGIKRRIKATYISWFVKQCRGVLVCGRLGREYFVNYDVEPSRIYAFPYEPDYDLIRSVSPMQIDEVRRRHGFAADRQRIIYSGRLAPEKRVDLVMDAFSRIAHERADWDLVVLGSGPLRNSLAERIPPSLQDRVHWIPFLDDQAAVAALYRACHILVLPSDYEPWAVVINEAAAAGLALIASDSVGAAHELIRDGVNGFVFSRGNLSDFADRLRQATLAGQAIALGRNSAAMLADWQTQADPVHGLRMALRDAGVVT